MDFPKCLPEVFPPLLMEEPRRNQLEWGAWSSMDRSGCHRWGCSINKYLNSYRIKLFQSASACAGNGQALPTVLHVHQTPFFHFYLYNLCLTSSLLLVCCEGHVSNTQGMGSGDWEEAVGGERLLFQYSHRVLSGEGLGQTLLRDTEEQQITLML